VTRSGTFHHHFRRFKSAAVGVSIVGGLVAGLLSADVLAQTGGPFISTDPDVLCTTLNVQGDIALLEGDIAVGYCRRDGEHWSFQPSGSLGYAVCGRLPRAGLRAPSWPDVTIPFVIASSLSEASAPEAHVNLQRAIRHWKDVAGIRLVPRTTEADYVKFVAGSRCSSFIGRISGSQPVTLAANGSCTFGATVHEIGHALGFYHEQSRLDRDTYVTINFENIQLGREYNFAKYSMGAGNDVGPYDYGSIMHYGRTTFSNGGGNTIDPNEPQFSDWQAIYGNVDIGALIGLSVLDEDSTSFFREACYGSAPTGTPTWRTSEWSRCVSSCSTPGRTRLAYCVDASGNCVTDDNCEAGSRPAESDTCASAMTCDFETDTCGWDHRDVEGDFPWVVGKGPTPAAGSGPSFDHTTEINSGSYYFIEAVGPRMTGDVAYMTSMPFDVAGTASLTFWYHTFGSNTQPIELQAIDCASSTPTTLWTSDGTSQDVWRHAAVVLPIASGIRLRFVGTLGGTFRSDAALDDIRFNEGVCGNDTVEGSEECDGTDDDACPGECAPAATRGECTCPFACNASPTPGCLQASQAKIRYTETVEGRERMKVQWKGIPTPTTQADFGDPNAVSAVAAMCIYDDATALVGQLAVARAGDSCAGKPCWRATGTKGYRYVDKENASDGISTLRYRSGEPGKGRANARGKNDIVNGQLALPTGVAALAPTIELVTSKGLCIGATMTEVDRDTGDHYAARKK